MTVSSSSWNYKSVTLTKNRLRIDCAPSCFKLPSRASWLLQLGISLCCRLVLPSPTSPFHGGANNSNNSWGQTWSHLMDKCLPLSVQRDTWNSVLYIHNLNGCQRGDHFFFGCS